jgi:glycosyltransferase involved in cell wall biosynthesis
LRIALGVYANEPSGLAVATVDTALALVDAGADVTLFALPGSDLPPRAESLADRVIRLRRPRFQGRIAGSALFLLSKLAASARFAEALESERFDAVHVFSPGMAARLPARHRVSTQAWFHPPRLGARLRTMMPFTSTPAMYPAALVLQTQSHLADVAGYRRADLVIANTEVAAAAMTQRGFRSACVPPALGVGTAPIEREPSPAFRVVFCSHPLGGHRKGLRFLLEALEAVRHRPLEVTLVGGEDERFDAAIASVRRTGVEVELTGRVRREEYLDRLSRRTDLLAFPSLYEEWGYALFEALGQGVPALAFDLYPFSEILDERTGILVPPRDPEALAAAIDRAAAGGLPAPETVRDSTRERFGSASVAARLLEAWA